MDGGWALILSAVVTAVGTIIVALLSMVRKENKEDHAVVSGLLKMVYNRTVRVEDKIDKVDERLTAHVESHAHGDAHKN